MPMLRGLDIARRRPAPAGRAAALAADPAVAAALASFARDRRVVDEQHLALCRIPAPTFLESRRAAWMKEQFEALGWDARLDRAGNLFALPSPEKGSLLVAITAHLDTVLAPERPGDVSVLDDGRFSGPGVTDNGSGLAALLALARAFKLIPRAAGLPQPLLVANVGEEGDGNLSGMKYLCQNSPLAPRIRAYLVLDGPALDHITSTALACRRFEVTFSGPGGHSWSDFGSPNPVHALCRAIAGFAAAMEEAETEVRSSYNFGIIEGGSSVNAIPAEARARLDLRSENPVRLEQLVALLQGALEKARADELARSAGGKLALRLRETGARPGGRLDAASPLLAALREVDALLGIQAVEDCASTDANVPLSMGLQAVSIGAGGAGAGAHTPGEWYRPEGRELGLRRILLTTLLLLEAAGPA